MDLDFFAKSLEDLTGQELDDWTVQLIVIVGIVLFIWLLRWFVTPLVIRLIKLAIRRTQTQVDDRVVEAILPPVRFLVSVLGIWLILSLLDLPDDITSFANQLIASLVAVAIFWAVYRSVDLAVAALWRVGKTTMSDSSFPQILDKRLAQVVGQLAKGIIFIFAITTVMETWGYDVGGLVAGLGIGGLAVALAAQDALANLIGYFVILADEPFVIGDYIVIDGEVSGTVEAIRFRSTRIRVVDQSLVSVPNNTIMSANITNWSRLAKRRLNMTLGIEYNSSPDQVLSIVQAIREMLQAHDLVQDDSVTVQFVEFSSSSLDILIICFMKTPAWSDFQAAKQDINLKIMHILEERGVNVAFPTRTIVVEQQPPAQRAEIEKPIPLPKPEPALGEATDSPVPDDAAN